jgi:hypothetical protein
MDIDGARRRSNEPTVGRLELGLGWPESTHGWTGTTARAASLDYSEWSEKRGAGLVRLDRVEGGDSGRTGPGDDPRFTVGRLVTQPLATDNSNGTFPQRYVLSFIRIQTNQAEYTIFSPKMMNTSDTTALSCGEPCIRST